MRSSLDYAAEFAQLRGSVPIMRAHDRIIPPSLAESVNVRTGANIPCLQTRTCLMIRNPCLKIRKSVDNVSSVLRVGASKNVKSMLILVKFWTKLLPPDAIF